MLGALEPDYQRNDFSISAVAEQARVLFEQAAAGEKSAAAEKIESAAV